MTFEKVKEILVEELGLDEEVNLTDNLKMTWMQTHLTLQRLL